MNYTQCSFEDVHAIAGKIDGWLTFEEAELLFDKAKSLKGSGAIVEIGSWCSKSLTYTTMAALSVGNNCKKYSIDPFLTSKDEPNGKYETFISNLKQNDLYDKIIHIKEKSQIAGENFDEKIEMIFIDGFHKYESVKKDFELFFPKVVAGGYILLHDVTYSEGPTRLVKELANHPQLSFKEFFGVMFVAQKVASLSEEDKINNQKIINQIQEKLEKDKANNFVLVG